MSIKFAASELGVKPEIGVEFPTRNIVAVCFMIICLFSVYLVGCSTKAPTEIVQATIHITKIVDRATQRPINSKIVTLRWETPDGEVIKTEQHRNQSDITTSTSSSAWLAAWDSPNRAAAQRSEG
jgi:hypothetical protein